MTLEQKTKRIMTIVSSAFACAILVGAISVTGAQADVGYDRGEKLKGFTYDHDKASESKAKKACNSLDEKEECIECIEYRADLQGLKGYEVVKCLKEPDKYHY
ncbi:MAG: hypothetical protein M3530_02920 [Thermoproteota archaeon]|jgi:hypothetical protein|nr:hypothetical protein [Thermoproteota archaeon]